ncbi:MAG: tetratricopeptide repeat protein [Planctomycetota bacterium]
MSTKTLLISSVLSGVLLFMAAGQCFADASAQFKQADDYKQNKQYEQAEAIYLQIATSYPGSDDALEAQKKLTLIYIATDRQQQADAAFEQLVTDFYEHTGISQTVWQIAKGYELTKKYDKALELHQYNVQQFSPDRLAMWSQTEIIYLNINGGENAASDAAFEKLLTLFSSQPTLPKEIHHIAMKYNHLKRYDKALEIYQYNAEHSPKDNIYAMWSQVEIVKSHIRNANDAAADVACDMLLSAFSEQPTLSKEVYQIADLYSKAGKSTKAGRFYQHVVDNWPKSAQAMPAQMNLAIYYVDQGDDLNAQAATDKLISNYSQNLQIARAIHDVAQHYRLSGKNEKANQLYQYNAEHSPKNDMYTMWSQVEIVKSHIRNANDAAADAACDTLLSTFSEQPTLSKEAYEIADLYSKAGRVNKAAALHQYNVEHLFKDDKYSMWSLVEIIKSHIHNANDGAADEACDILLGEFSQLPAFPTEVYQIAMRYKKSGRDEKAIELHQFNIEHSSRDDMYTMWSKVEIVKSYIRDANDAAADEAFDKLLAEFSGQPTLSKEIYQIVDGYAMAGRYDKADQIYQHVLDNWPEAEQAGLEHIGVAEINVLSLIESGNDTAAKEALDSLIADFNEHPDLAWTLDGIAGRYEKVQKYDDARSIYQKIVTDHNETDYAFTAQKKLAILEITVGDDVAAQVALDTLIADFNDHPALPETVFEIGEQYYYKAFDDHKKCIKVKFEENLYKAKDIWERIVAQWPESKSIGLKHAQYFTAVCYRRFGEYEKALSHYQKVVDNWPDYQYAWSAQYLIGSCYEKLRYYNSLPESEASLKIEQAYKAVVEKYPDSAMVPTASLKLGHLNLKIGKKIEAAQYFALFLATARPTDPRIESVESHLEQLKGEEQ